MSAMKIHGSEYAINNVFSDDFAFDIPHYRRSHLHTTDQMDELLNDALGTLKAQAHRGPRHARVRFELSRQPSGSL